MKTPNLRYAFFLLLKASSGWLSLSRSERAEIAGTHLQKAIAACKGELSIRHFDAEAFHAPCSDVMLVETSDPWHHYRFMESLRDSPLICEGYFEVLSVISSIEEGYAVYESEPAPESESKLETQA